MMVSKIQLKPEYSNCQQIATDPIVAIFENVVSDQEIDHIISKSKDYLKRAGVSLLEGSKEHKARTGKNHWLRYDNDDVVNAVGSRIAEIVGIPLENAEALQVIHYDSGQEYKIHFDAYDLSTQIGQSCCKYGGQRLVTALVYLNDVEEGGETSFPKLSAEVQAKKGRMVIFHNVTDDFNVPHPNSLHAGMPVIKGEKWAFNIWFRARPMTEVQTFPPIKSSVNDVNGSNDSADDLPVLSGIINRCHRIFNPAIDNVSKRISNTNQKFCLSYWDTFDRNIFDFRLLDTRIKLLKLIERKHTDYLANKKSLGDLISQNNLFDVAPVTFNDVASAYACKTNNSNLWFVKAILGNGSKGMLCIAHENLKNFVLPNGFLIQAGVDSIELFNHKKFTARFYVLIWNRHVYLYNDGWMIVHGVDYDPKSTDYKVQIDHAGYADSNSPIKMYPLTHKENFEKYFVNFQSVLIRMKPIFSCALQNSNLHDYTILGIDTIFQLGNKIKILKISTYPNLNHTNEINQKINIPFVESAIETMMGINHPSLIQVY